MAKTPKQLVLKKWPKAFAKQGVMSGKWYVHPDNNRVPLAVAETAALAWKEAAKTL